MFSLSSGMNDFQIFALKAFRRMVKKCGLAYLPPPMQREMDPDKASEIIYNLLIDDKPCMIARFGSTELSAIINYLGVSSDEHSVWKYIRGEQPEWWWNGSIMSQMQQWSGFFPPTSQMLNMFCRMMLEDAKEVDVLACWTTDVMRLADYTPADVVRTGLICIEPYWAKRPWSRALAGKRVVVVHPFAELIEQQYREHRHELFKNSDVLPDFSLRVIKAVQSLGGESSEYSDWFEALDSMKKAIDSEPYDIAIIGCGAYGFPLAAHVKRTGHKAVHLAGALQLLFGIRGKRWDNPEYAGNSDGTYANYNTLWNGAWVYPDTSLKVKNSHKIEGGCYW